MRAVECHCFRASVCVCSGHIPHHKCCSVYVLSRVQFAFHTTQFSHHIKHFHITHHSITSHQKILHHTTFHVTPPLHNIPHHITTYRLFHATSLRHLMSQRISPRTTIFYIWHHITPQSASHHHFTPPHLKAQHIPHHTATVHIAPFHIHNYSTPHPHSTPQHISHHTIFHIAYHLILILHRHTTTADITTHCIIFHIWRHTTTAHCICHILHHHNSTPPHFTSPNFPHFALCNIPHNEAPQSIFDIAHYAFHITPGLKIPHRTTFHIHITPHFTSHHIIHLKSRDSSTCQHTISHAHIPPLTSPHSNIKLHITLSTAHIYHYGWIIPSVSLSHVTYTGINSMHSQKTMQP